MLITEFLSALETVVPLSAAGYARDAIGLQVGLPGSTELRAALFAYEVTRDVIHEARERGANLIVAFHPLIFPTIDAITDATRTGDLIRQLIQSEIALYVQHTAFDTHPVFGTSRLMAEALGLTDIRVLVPLEKQPGGMGVIAKLETPVSREAFLERVRVAFGSPCIRYNPLRSNESERISSVAMVGGAGMEFYSAAQRSGAQAFITADIRYHDFYRAAHDGIFLLDAGHAETEKNVTRGMIAAAGSALRDSVRNGSTLKGSAMSGSELNLQEQQKKAVNLHSGSRDRVRDRVKDLLLQARTEPNAVRYYLPS